METQVGRMAEALESPDPWSALSYAFPAIWETLEAVVKLTGLDGTEVKGRLTALYGQYVAEWKAFIRLARAT